MKKNNGFSIIECMLAITLSVLLFSFLLEIYFLGFNSHLLQMALIDLEHNAKTVLHILETEIKQSGVIGCARLTNDFPIHQQGMYSITLQNQLQGFPHSILVRHVSKKQNFLVEHMRNKKILQTNKHIHFKKKDILLITDCKKAEIFEVKNVITEKGTQKIIPLHSLHNQFSQGSQVARFEINKFYITKSTKRNEEDGSHFSFCVEDIHHRKIEIVDHINQMDFKYTVKKGGGLVDLSANQIVDWSKVVGIAISVDLISYPFQKKWYLYVSRES